MPRADRCAPDYPAIFSRSHRCISLLLPTLRTGESGDRCAGTSAGPTPTWAAIRRRDAGSSVVGAHDLEPRTGSKRHSSCFGPGPAHWAESAGTPSLFAPFPAARAAGERRASAKEKAGTGSIGDSPPPHPKEPGMHPLDDRASGQHACAPRAACSQRPGDLHASECCSRLQNGRRMACRPFAAEVVAVRQYWA
jgi:hypothetical protein